MKTTTLRVFLVVASFFELYLLTGILPTNWQAVLNHAISTVLPRAYDYSAITHPELSAELERARGTNVGLQIFTHGIYAALVIGNAWLIYLVLKKLRDKQ